MLFFLKSIGIWWHKYLSELRESLTTSSQNLQKLNTCSADTHKAMGTTWGFKTWICKTRQNVEGMQTRDTVEKPMLMSRCKQFGNLKVGFEILPKVNKFCTCYGYVYAYLADGLFKVTLVTKWLKTILYMFCTNCVYMHCFLWWNTFGPTMQCSHTFWGILFIRQLVLVSSSN